VQKINFIVLFSLASTVMFFKYNSWQIFQVLVKKNCNHRSSVEYIIHKIATNIAHNFLLNFDLILSFKQTTGRMQQR